jgi:hypothetical protein
MLINSGKGEGEMGKGKNQRAAVTLLSSLFSLLCLL